MWKAIWSKMQHLKPGQYLVLGFLSVILVGTLLLMLPFSTVQDGSLSFLNALFTATSAVCVTGLTVVNTGLAFTLFGQIVITCLIQVGGLGFMTIASLVFLMIGKRISLRERLLIQESFNADSLQGLVKLVRNAVVVTFLLEGAAAIIFAFRFIPEYGYGQGLFQSVFMAVSAFCNAGFDPFGFANSIEPFIADPVINFTIMVLVVLGGMGFSVILDVLHHRRFRKLMLHSRVVLIMTGILLVTGTLLIAVLEWNNPLTIGSPDLNVGEKLMASMFQSVTLRTAGFDTIGQNDLTPAGQLLSIILMFIGASPASTGGGIKTTTFFMVALYAVTTVRRKQDYNILGRRLNEQTVKRALAIFTLALGLILVDTVIISAVESMTHGTESLEQVLFEVVSAFGTVGLSTGITPTLNGVSKLFIICTMFLGRVGPLTVSMALSGGPGKPNALRYPEDRLMAG